ncbi:MAG TPA: hypothetical protein VIV40_05630 [Kofleriaceae bacterium]
MTPSADASLTPPSLQRPSTWRIVLAAILDFLTAFIGFGSLIAQITGDLHSNGFHLEGLPALVLFALVVLYFVVGRRVGGPIWRRVLRAR